MICATDWLTHEETVGDNLDRVWNRRNRIAKTY